VAGLVAIAPACGFDVADPKRSTWAARLPHTEGWAKYNKHYWLDGDYDEFLRFFFGQVFSEPHSTKQIEDCVGWGHEIAPATLADTTAGQLGLEGAETVPIEETCGRVRCPVLVVHGTDDRVRPVAIGRRLAELTGGSLVLVEGGGHGLPGRSPVRVNLLIRDFVLAHRGRRRRAGPRALYLSSPIGLGHARRDVAIAQELRRRRPELRIDWLAQHPVTEVLTTAGEHVHRASAWLASESGHVEAEAGEHDLHAFEAIRRMDEILVGNFMVCNDVLESEHYDLVIGDEAWELDYFLHENPRLKRFAFAWMTDFVGWLPVTGADRREVALTADYNAEMLEQRARFAHVRDRSVFVGNPDDVVDLPFGAGLPSIREWTVENFDFSGYVTGFSPPPVPPRIDHRLCVVAVGGSGVGEPLLRRVLAAVPAIRRSVPDLEFLVVTGPRIDPRRLPCPPGVQVRGYVPDLHRTLAACELAIVQGGLTTCMELTAARRPFLYVPLRRHFEQNIHVRHRLSQYHAGRCVPYESLTPDHLAAAVTAELGRAVDYRPVESDGAARAAGLLADLVP
jgi:predicted glycosyltransferase